MTDRTTVLCAWQLRPGDRILAVDGTPVDGLSAAGSTGPGVLLPVWAGGRTVYVAPAARCEVARG